MDILMLTENAPRPQLATPFTETGSFRSRLPTPEMSHGSSISSNEDTADEGRSPGSHKRPRYEPPMHRDYSTDSIHLEVTKELSRSRRDSAVHSPPYQSADIERPLLPPIKSFFCDTERSPPKTPSPRQSCVDFSSREPSFMTSNSNLPYMPPSFYEPNKKQKRSIDTDSVYNSSRNSSIVQLPASSTMTSKLDLPASRSTVSLPPISSQLDGFEPRRPPPPPPSISSSHIHSSPLWPSSSSLPVQQLFKSSNDRLTVDGPCFDYPTPDRSSLPAYSRANSVGSMLHDSYRSYPGESREPSVHRELHDHSLSSRGSFSNTYNNNNYTTRAHERDGLSRSYPPRHDARPSAEGWMGPREHHHQRFGRYDEHHNGGYGPPGSTYGPPFFMPSHFDYQQGKARKRSNLPKHSTEIMKQWFDQNISNPYPTEEQKQRFSNITGISMTQVSNWFINHRRRCPELKDKRENKGRSNSE